MSWTKAVNLKYWANNDPARGRLPLLIRRLIRRTLPNAEVNFPAEEQVHRPGYDGVVATANEGNQFVPIGKSAWEMGVDANPQSKASKDFNTRTEKTSREEQERTTYIFVTPREWQKKDEWVQKAKEREDCHWQDVVVLDCNDLEHWLELAPSVDRWITSEIGQLPVSGVSPLPTHWQSLSAISDPPLCPEVFTVSREEAASKIEEFIAGEANSLFIRTLGYFDGPDYLSALQAERSEGAEKYLENCLVVSSRDSWAELCSSPEPLVLTTQLALTSTDVASAVHGGHHVIVTAPRAISVQDPGYELPRQSNYAVSEALQKSGFDEPTARSKSRAAHGSSSILKRLISTHPDRVLPEWCSDDNKHELAPFGLLGGWLHIESTPSESAFPSSVPIDTEFVLEFMGRDLEQLTIVLSRWSQVEEPLFVRFGSSVLIASREDAWHLLGGSITAQQLRRFADLCTLVLGEDDPAFEMPQEDRWLANVYNKVPSNSGDFRRSLVETMVLMTSCPTMDRPVGTVDFPGTVRQIVSEILPIGATWERWASFGMSLLTLAEADPAYFLDCVEADLRSDEPELPKLFQDSTHNVFSGAIHSDLLWALETLSWSPDWLPRASQALATLAQLDPGGTFSNRPANSLADIFLIGMSHTNASNQVRIQCLASILDSEPEVGWQLMKALLPGGGSSFTSGTQMPRWRDWANGWSRNQNANDYLVAVAELAREKAGGDFTAWSEIVSGLLWIPGSPTLATIDELERLAALETPDVQKRPLWNALRKCLLLNKENADEGVVKRLEAVLERLSPVDPVQQYSWLFEKGAYWVARRDDWDHEEFGKQQVSALAAICEQSGFDGVSELLTLADDVGNIGWLIGANKLLSIADFDLRSLLQSENQAERNFSRSFFSGAHHVDSFGCVDGLQLTDWTAEEVVSVGTCFPFNTETWNWIAEFGETEAKEYWKKVGIPRWGIKELASASRAAESLIEADRGFDAISVLSGVVQRDVNVPSEVIAGLLETAAKTNDKTPSSESGHEIQELIKAVQADGDFDHRRLAKIEWLYLNVFESVGLRMRGDVQPLALMDEISSNPKFFVELVEWAYLAEDEEQSAVTEERRILGRQATRLLNSIERLPSSENDDVDIDGLEKWVESVREQLTASGRLSSCDALLGQIFARCTLNRDELWPSSEIAKLIEQIASDSFISGFTTQVVNSRGMTSRSPTAGGEQERVLVSRFQNLADNIRADSGKLASAFIRLKEGYEREANREDARADRVRWGP